ncbi:hypothetical protein COT30_02275 [Candidatus Micrarchaeota archaeon CG08_land_8_20_14_0_20_49_17]|nr:MAG: hypothetical protein COT30_02275 [Candidatus Micrarchaeota archaeon CG08_land_8_20_14_0_20_49_17]PIU81606.1 MAG: hypothetical protein COS70_03195 [Candidatus Micrarchaeota archaeon CG06_land_8_20_14_3_00_50_6]
MHCNRCCLSDSGISLPLERALRPAGRVSSQFIPQLDAKVKEILEAAIKRAEKNGRSTVMPQDL